MSVHAPDYSKTGFEGNPDIYGIGEAHPFHHLIILTEFCANAPKASESATTHKLRRYG
jgi:hypothetical protein